jgi:hypothetical protein
MFATTRNRRCASGCVNGSAAGPGGGTRGVPPVALENRFSRFGRQVLHNNAEGVLVCLTKLR